MEALADDLKRLRIERRGRVFKIGQLELIDRQFAREKIEMNGDLYHHGATGGFLGQPASRADRGVELFMSLDDKNLFAHRSCETGLVHIMELVGKFFVTPDPAGKHQHGDLIKKGLGDPGHGIGESSTGDEIEGGQGSRGDRKSTRLNSSHSSISY